ncbi:IS200/IS605 family element transposase accessory protein TnpB [Nocardia sp. ET3-3]|uniref:IS200/IS605 family element transposase accessory protein TnpB n=1 Tax=Nocardia terrae TaxID=2675851 RepID=A0A7K1UW65_9NOCA|nr:RNA-guided endonuclease TnpB family protein [Nocardia terrae]MVU78575.1 IS200/IS605 family element transposase accessory protein TnpB [Nocardia terrae]
MSRHTTFRYRLDPTVEQAAALARHAGAARFAFNQCLGIVKTALTQHEGDPEHAVPWTRFDLINTFNRWKKTEAAGRVFAAGSNGPAEIVVTGLAWRKQVSQQVFEEAASDCGRALAAFSNSRNGKRRGPRVGFPRFKSKKGATASFRLRNKYGTGGSPSIRVGDNEIPRSVTLPIIGMLALCEDTRRLRRLLASGRAKILSVTVTEKLGRWSISVTCEAADLHSAHQHRRRDSEDREGWVGVDRGLSTFVVAATADGSETDRIDSQPRPLAVGLRQLRKLSKAVTRKEKGSRNRERAVARLARHHHRVANVRRHFLHQVTNRLVKTHDRLVIENLHVAGMLRNRRLARAISDVGWGEFARLLAYKQQWRGGEVVTPDRWYPSSKRCSACGTINTALTLSDRQFVCGCGFRADRDLNAAINLAEWAAARQDVSRSPDLPAGGRVIKARRREGAGRHSSGVGGTGPVDAGTDTHTAALPV